MGKIKQLACFFVVISVMMVLQLVVTLLLTIPSSNSSDSGNSSNRSVSYSSINGTKKILLWTNSWGYRFLPMGRLSFIDRACPISNCLITYNSSSVEHLEDFDAFVIHPPTQRSRWTALKQRRAEHIFVLFSTEPPYHMPPMTPFDNYFNWSMTYLHDSDFHLRYGDIVALATAPTNRREVMALRREVGAAGVNPARGKSKLAVWLVSNCQSPSNREEYVTKLRQFVTIDVWSQDGRCRGVDACPRRDNGAVCYDRIERHYKFYLSFENSICREYVTEKFFEMMARNVVPVVLGGADYAAIAPPHSFINALDYSPQQLAVYLKRLDADDSLYAEYFWWKPHYQVRNLIDTNRQVFCDLCAALHGQPLKRQTLTALQKWYVEDSQCRDHPHY